MKSGTVHKNTEDYPPSCLSKAKSLKKKEKALVLMSAALLLLSSCSLFGEHLAFFNWGEYVNEDVLAESPVPVEMQNFEDNVEMLTKLTTTSYDVVVPSDYAIEELASEGKLEELDLSKFKNYSVSRLEESYREALDGLKQDTLEVQEDGSKKVVRSGFDLLKYAVPYTYGEIGIIYDKTKVSEEELDRYGWESSRPSARTARREESSSTTNRGTCSRWRYSPPGTASPFRPTRRSTKRWTG
jgi:spermidine/putrescine-binding protein